MSSEGALRGHIVTDPKRISEIAAGAKRVAVLGIKTEAQSGQPAFYVPSYLASSRVEIVPVPVYYPDVTTILGRTVYRRLADIPGEIDVVCVFRRSEDIPPHVDDILAKRPCVVWMQSGIQNDAVARRLVEAGIDVVQNRCLMVEHRAARLS